MVIVMWLCQICFKSCMETSLQFCGSGWDQQMSYTWFSDRWVLPAPYYKTSMVYEDRTICAHCRVKSINFNQCQSVRSAGSQSATAAMLQGPGVRCGRFFPWHQFPWRQASWRGLLWYRLWMFVMDLHWLSHGSHLSCGLAGSKSQHVQLQE